MLLVYASRFGHFAQNLGRDKVEIFYKSQTKEHLSICLYVKVQIEVQMPDPKIPLNPPVISNTILKTSITAVDANDQTEVQMLYSRWLIHMPVMSMTKLKNKYHTQGNLSTCLCCQRSNWCTNTIHKNTSQSACDAKEHTQVHMPAQEYLTRSKDQRTNLSTNWIPKNIS